MPIQVYIQISMYTLPSLSQSELLLAESLSNNFWYFRYTMQSTKLLSLAGQNLIELPQEVLENACKADVSTVDLSRNKLSELPDQLCMITAIADLKLTSNELTHIPEWIGEKYKYLQTLDLSKNFLESLPSTLGLLKYLREINISFNRYYVYSTYINNLTRITNIIA